MRSSTPLYILHGPPSLFSPLLKIQPTFVWTYLGPRQIHFARECVSVLLSAAPGSSTCPVEALKHPFRTNPQPATSPLFSGPDGSPLSRSIFISTLKTRLLAIGLDLSSYSGHSFRRGAASTAAAVGYADHEIQLLGRWRSDAYKLYINVS